MEFGPEVGVLLRARMTDGQGERNATAAFHAADLGLRTGFALSVPIGPRCAFARLGYSVGLMYVGKEGRGGPHGHNLSGVATVGMMY
jgi:hypothetical protein